MSKIYDSLIKVSLSSQPREVPIFTDEPKFYNYFTVPNKSADRKYDIDNIYGQGFDANRSLSKIKSVGEVLERLCLSNHKKYFLRRIFQEGKNFVRPSLFFCYSKEQISNLENKKKELDKGEYQWMKVKKISEERNIYVPAQMVFYLNLLVMNMH